MLTDVLTDVVNALFNTRRWSLTTRLTLFFGTAIAVIVVIVSAMMYAELVHQLHIVDVDELLEDMNAQQEHLVKRRDGIATEQPDDNQFAWQLRRPDGSQDFASVNARGFMAAIKLQVPDGRVERFSADGRTFIVVDAAARDGTGRLLRGVLDVSQDERVVRGYLAKLLIVVVLAIAIAAGLGWLLARRALRPLRAMNNQIARLGADRLHTRIAQDVWPAELRTLAVTFDELMARIQRSFEHLSRFSSDLAHEIRSPMTNLVAAASVTLGRARSPQEYQNTLEIVVEEGGRLARMVSNMLFLARADNASQVLQREPLRSRTEFDKLIDFFGIVAEEQGVTLVGHGDVEVLADPALLRQALSNLLTNALRYTARGGTIGLSAEENGGGVAIRVTDDGAGIAQEHLPFLFDRFFRADPARSSADSTGLGLALVRSITELHGGTIEVHSQLGVGTCFLLWLPKQG